MRQEKGSINIGMMLFMVSLIANVVMAMVLAGCTDLDLDFLNPKQPVRDESSLNQLKDVAKRLGVEVGAEGEAVDVASSIRIAIDESKVTVPEPLSEKAARASLRVIGDADKQLFKMQEEFLKKLQGKRVLVLPDDQAHCHGPAGAAK